MEYEHAAFALVLWVTIWQNHRVIVDPTILYVNAKSAATPGLGRRPVLRSCLLPLRNVPRNAAGESWAPGGWAFSLLQGFPGLQLAAAGHVAGAGLFSSSLRPCIVVR